MGFSREQIIDALTWEGSSRTDGTDPDYYIEILEGADPTIIAAEHRKLVEYNWGLAVPSRQEPTELIKPESRKARKVREEKRYLRSLPWHFIQD